MIIYDPQGDVHDKEPIDAYECINRLGWTTFFRGGLALTIDPPKSPELPEPSAVSKKKAKGDDGA